VTTSLDQLARLAVIGALSVGIGATPSQRAVPGEVVVASGTLDGRFLADALFHINEFWMRVPPGTEFNRWLSQGVHQHVIVTLTTDPARFGDEKNVRILSGALMHEIAGQFTPTSVDRVGRLPEGNSGFVHVFFAKDDIAGSGTLSAVTFETSDLATVAKFSPYESAHINIVIQIQ
jgi:hypothetical protein